MHGHTLPPASPAARYIHRPLRPRPRTRKNLLALVVLDRAARIPPATTFVSFPWRIALTALPPPHACIMVSRRSLDVARPPAGPSKNCKSPGFGPRKSPAPRPTPLVLDSPRAPAKNGDSRADKARDKLMLDCSLSPIKAGRPVTGPSPGARASSSPPVRQSSPSPAKRSLADSPCHLQYKMRKETNGWRELGERYKKVHANQPSIKHDGLLDGWIPQIIALSSGADSRSARQTMPPPGPRKHSDQSPTSSDFFTQIQALGTQLQTAMGLEGEGQSDLRNPTHDTARCTLCGDKPPEKKRACVMCGAEVGDKKSCDKAGDKKAPHGTPERGRGRERHIGVAQALEGTKPVLAKYLNAEKKSS